MLENGKKLRRQKPLLHGILNAGKNIVVGVLHSRARTSSSASTTAISVMVKKEGV